MASSSSSSSATTTNKTPFANDKYLTLEESMAKPQKFRDMDIANTPMYNFKSTPNGPNGGLPFSFWAAWQLNQRPRRIALLLDDCQEEYRDFAQDILPNLKLLTSVFRDSQQEHNNKDNKDKAVCIVWSAWSRTLEDGISNSMDRWYGPSGLRPTQPENALYIFNGESGMEPFQEIAPTLEERQEGWFYHGKHLDMFWNFRDDGKSYLDEKLKELDIDTIVLAGLWTDECILATAYAGSSRGYDVVVVSDAVGTATAHQQAALTIAGGTVANVLTTEQVVQYMKNEFVVGPPGLVKGRNYPDGRKEE